jgi:hypothetical protein
MGKRKRGQKRDNWNSRGVPNRKKWRIYEFCGRHLGDKRLCFDDAFPQP